MNSVSDWRDEAIRRDHDRAAFDCGDAALNDFLKKHARQNDERGLSRTFVAVRGEPGKIIGFYSLSPASIEQARVPESARRGMARYDVPGFRLGRIAVDTSMQGQGLGGQLILAAARRCIRAASEVGGSVLVIDAKNERVANWYKGYGAIALIDSSLTLVLPLEILSVLLRDTDRL